MKLLLDENLPHQMRLDLSMHQVFTSAYMGWSGIENGELLKRAASEGFDALLSNDRGIEYEQNLSELPIAVVVLLAPANPSEAIRPLYPRLREILQQLSPGQFVKLTVA